MAEAASRCARRLARKGRERRRRKKSTRRCSSESWLFLQNRFSKAMTRHSDGKSCKRQVMPGVIVVPAMTGIQRSNSKPSGLTWPGPLPGCSMTALEHCTSWPKLRVNKLCSSQLLSAPLGSSQLLSAALSSCFMLPAVLAQKL